MYLKSMLPKHGPYLPKSLHHKTQKLTKKEQKTSFDIDLDKMRHYCGYQERCFFDLREKAKRIGLSFNDLERMIPILEQEEFYNEARFAIHFAGGKFRLKKWGKYKIRQQLRSKMVPKPLIEKAIALIPDEDYVETLRQLIIQKNKEYGNTPHKNYAKLARFFAQKGYEASLFQQEFNQLFPRL